MPIQYSGIIEEHRAVRIAAGLFDLSHMGELVVEGADAGRRARRRPRQRPALARGRARPLLDDLRPGRRDHRRPHRLPPGRGPVHGRRQRLNARVVSDALAERLAGFRAVLDDRSLATGLVAVQGPRSLDILGPLTDLDLDALRYYGIAEGVVAGIPAQVARTGYTGEDGFELFVDVDRAGELWDALLEAGRPHGQVPVGLGARDTLRLEAGMPLYGNELDRTTNPYEAGLGRVVKLDKAGDFVGRAALERVARDGLQRQLVGLAIRGRGIARHGYPVHAGRAPRRGRRHLGHDVADARRAHRDGLRAAADAGPGTMLAVEIRGAPVAAEVVPLPFYKRQA